MQTSVNFGIPTGGSKSSLHYSTASVPPINATSVPYFVQGVHTVDPSKEPHPAFAFMTGAILTNSATSMGHIIQMLANNEVLTMPLAQVGQSETASSGNLSIASPTMLYPGQNSFSAHIPAYSTPQNTTDSTGGFGMNVRSSRIHILSSKIEDDYGYMDFERNVDYLVGDTTEKEMVSITIPSGKRYLVIGSFTRAFQTGTSNRSNASFSQLALKSGSSVLVDYAQEINPTYQTTWSNISKAVNSLVMPYITDVLQNEAVLKFVGTKTDSNAVTLSGVGIFAAPFLNNNFVVVPNTPFAGSEGVWVNSLSQNITTSRGSRLFISIPIFYSGSGFARVRTEVYVDGVEVSATNQTENNVSATGGFIIHTHTGGISHHLAEGEHTVLIKTWKGAGTYSAYMKPIILEIKN